METTEIIAAILIYFVLPVLVIFGTMMILRRKREKDAGRIKSTKEKDVKATEIKDIKAEEAREARHKKADEPTEKTQPGSSEDKNKNTKL
ncbi:MAG: hypothetical protein ACNS60_19100 [Candidatus Cyclobacteriaceae bacterium M2_1C_046]